MKEWEKQQGESSKAYEAFCMYRDLGIGRQYTKTAEALKKNVSLINRWARRYEWKERADAWDKSVMEEGRKQAAIEYKDMIMRQIQIGRMLQTKAANTIQSRDLEKASIHSLIIAIEKGADLERTARELEIKENKTTVKSDNENNVIIYIPDNGRN